MNSHEQSMNDPLFLTVAEYARRFDVSENTVRTRINRKKIKTIKRVVDGRETILIEVEPFLDHSRMIHEQSNEYQETVHESFAEQRDEQPEQSEELFDFMRETFRAVQGYTAQIVELSRENERYKLISDTSVRTREILEREIEQLKSEVFQREARIKELEQLLPKKDELSTRLAQMEATLAEKEGVIEELNKLLKDEKNRNFISKLFRK